MVNRDRSAVKGFDRSVVVIVSVDKGINLLLAHLNRCGEHQPGNAFGARGSCETSSVAERRPVGGKQTGEVDLR
jgi:hypothetical protein